jgi:hypothetical protein
MTHMLESTHFFGPCAVRVSGLLFALLQSKCGAHVIESRVVLWHPWHGGARVTLTSGVRYGSEGSSSDRTLEQRIGPKRQQCHWRPDGALEILKGAKPPDLAVVTRLRWTIDDSAASAIYLM